MYVYILTLELPRYFRIWLSSLRLLWSFHYKQCSFDDTNSEWIYTKSVIDWGQINVTWWCHQMETFSALLAICAGNSPLTGEFPAQRPVTRSFDVFFDLRPNKRLSKQSWGWWFETPSCPLWRHCKEEMCYWCQYMSLWFSTKSWSRRLVDVELLFLRPPKQIEGVGWVVGCGVGFWGSGEVGGCGRWGWGSGDGVDGGGSSKPRFAGSICGEYITNVARTILSALSRNC